MRGINGDETAPGADPIDRIIDRHHGAPSALIQVLLEIQSENHWLPKEALDRVSEKLKVPLAKIMQIVTFYKTFSLTPKQLGLIRQRERELNMGRSSLLRVLFDVEVVVGIFKRRIGIVAAAITADEFLVLP